MAHSPCGLLCLLLPDLSCFHPFTSHPVPNSFFSNHHSLPSRAVNIVIAALQACRHPAYKCCAALAPCPDDLSLTCVSAGACSPQTAAAASAC
jgi:hypothetical protein